MKSFIIPSLLLGLVTAGYGQTAPANPIVLETEIGKFGETPVDTVTVSCLVRITKQGITQFIKIVGVDPTRGQPTLELPEEALPELISVIQKVRPQDKDMQERAAGYTISATTSVGSGVRTLSIERDNQVSPRQQVKLDPDATDAVLEMLKKGQSIQAWLKTRATALKP